MKISTKGRYGLRILIDLAEHDDNHPRLIHEIAESQQISEKYISRLIIALRERGLVKSVRGAKGGFILAKKPSEITLREVVEAMEGQISLVDCVTCPRICTRHAHCTARQAWCKLNDVFTQAMDKVTLKQLI